MIPQDSLLATMNRVFPQHSKEQLKIRAAWPPDLFAMTSLVLSATGLYRIILHLLDEGIARDEELSNRLKRYNIDLPRTEHPAKTDGTEVESEWARSTARHGGDWGRVVRDVVLDSRGAKSLVELVQDKKTTRQIVDMMPKAVQGCLNLLMEDYASRSMSEQFDIDAIDVRAEALLGQLGQRREPRGEAEEARIKAELRSLAASRNSALLGVALILTLHAYADEACGQLFVRGNGKGEAEFESLVQLALRDDATLSTAPTINGRVLPKRRTPEVGLTLRTLSSYVGYHRSSVTIRWRHARTLHHSAEPQTDYSSLSVLVLPWPLRIHATDFRVNSSPNGHRHSFFSYDVGSTNARIRDGEFGIRGFIRWLDHALVTAKAWEVDGVDLVVLPECAITREYIPALEAILASHGVGGYIVGVGGDRARVQWVPKSSTEADGPRIVSRDSLSGLNEVRCGFLKSGSPTPREAGVVYDPQRHTFRADGNDMLVVDYAYESFDQSKHHRWRLTEAQMAQYQLGWNLPARSYWWEGIGVPHRSMTFVDLEIARKSPAADRGREVVTVCPLICEDLARQDPMADLVRTVGPSLVVAILLDGPQLDRRWPGRYAGVLADDPGSSVLTVTSYGMVARTHSMREERSRAVALWRDSSGRTAEIDLGDDHIAILLGIGVRWDAEHTMAGRLEKRKSAKLTLNGALSYGSTKGARKHELKGPQAEMWDLLRRDGLLGPTPE